jgi:leader peptidase (prepilin peptidase)/N-methyltransferase
VVPAAALIPAVYLLAVTPALAVTDLRQHRLPNRMVVPGVVVGAVAAALQPSALPLLAGLAYAGLLLALSVAGGVGMGDVKLATLIGLGAPTAGVAVAAPVLAFILGGVAALVALLRRGPRVRIPFGPWMLAGYWVALLSAVASGTLDPGMLGSGTAGIAP